MPAELTPSPIASHLRYQAPHAQVAPAFGVDWFGLRAERFARFFGTPSFLLGQTAFVIAWVAANASGLAHFDLYPFIFLNLAFSLQAAYAAPLILLAQTRQADRDKALSDADAQHREAVAQAAHDQQTLALEQSRQLIELLQQNTQLTQMTRELSARIEVLTEQIHRKVVT